MNFRDFKALIMINQFAFSVLIMMVAISVCVRNFFGIDVVLICTILGVMAGARNGYIFAKKIFDDNNKR